MHIVCSTQYTLINIFCNSIPTGQIKLKATHPYYFQIQMQLLVTNADVGYFFLQTTSQYNKYHTEEICFDPMLVEEIIKKSTIFFQSVIQPELLRGLLKSSMEKDVQSMVASGSSGPDVLQSATTDDLPPSSAVNMLASISSALEFPCVVCSKGCVEDPDTIEETSILCYSCKEWSHWSCSRSSGNEAFLQNNVMNWDCETCAQGQ